MYLARYVLEIDWIGDGQGPMSIPSAQKLKLGSLEFAGLTTNNPTISNPGQPTGQLIVPGGNAPTQANFRTMLTGSTAAPTAGSMAADLDTAIAYNLTRLQGFATGGG